MLRDILIIDDEEDIRSLVSGILEDEGYRTSVAADSDAAVAILEAKPPPSLLILDIWLQGSKLDGMELLAGLQKSHPEIPVIMISGHGNIETAVAAIKQGAYDFIEKPFKSDRLLMQITRALEASDLRRENTELRAAVGNSPELIGSSNSLYTLKAAINKVAPTGSRVMISGPAGSGKEIVARLIHQKSCRSDGPFVVVSSAMMRPESMEQELFGAERSAAGSEHLKRVGTFERAHGGTLFFDEVADMPIETQGKLVRVIQEQSFERVGSGARVDVDVRVLAASNKNLAEEIKAKRFREDLFYRLSVVPINVPALSERRDDIPSLVRHLITDAADSSGLPFREITEDALAILQACHWPGNVRQLKNVIEWLLIMCPGTAADPITPKMLPPELGSGSNSELKNQLSGEIIGLSLRDAREIFERDYLAMQLSRFGGNISRTAQFVGMERSALHRKLKSLNISDIDRARNVDSTNEDSKRDQETE
jgi:two-component system nitrogen regulation response regulator NtrX